MTVDIPTRAPEQQAPDSGRRGLRGGPQITLGRQRPSKKLLLEVGGQPRANLLPPEIVLKRKQLKTRRALRVGVFFVFLATAAACFGVWALASVSQVALTLAQDQQARLVEQQLAYGEVREVQTTIATLHAGQEVGASTEVNIKSYLAALQKTLPSGVVLTTVSIELGTPMQAYAQSNLPLQGQRVGSITFSATSKGLPSIPSWLRGLEELPGFVDATPGSVKLEDGQYTAQVLMHINADAFSMRYDPAHVAAQAARDAAAALSDGTIKSMTAATDTTGTETTDTTDTTDEGGQ